MPDGMGVVPIVAVGATRRLREVGTVDSAVAVGCALAVGTVALAAEVTLRIGCSARSFPTPSLLDVVEGGCLSTMFRWGSAAATAALEVAAAGIAAGKLLAWAAGLEARAEAGRSVLPVVELVADGCDEFDEPSSAQAIPHVVKTAAPTPRATASPPTRPMHIEALIFHQTRAAKSVARIIMCLAPSAHDIQMCPVPH